MPRVSRQWADLSSDEEESGACWAAALSSEIKERSSPPSPCSTMAPASECDCDGAFMLPQPARWADFPESDSLECVDLVDVPKPKSFRSQGFMEQAARLSSIKSSAARWSELEDSDSEFLVEPDHVPPGEASTTQQRLSEASNHEESVVQRASPEDSRASRPRFSRVSRDQRVQQAKRAMDEFLSLDFDAVSPEEQGGLVQRMLGTVKSLEMQDTYWNSGERLEEDRYRLLGLEESDMYAIARHVKKASKHCEKRSFRKAYDELCDVRPWLQSEDLSSLRASWESKKQSKDNKKQRKQQNKEQEEAEGWQTVGINSKQEAKALSINREAQLEQTTSWEVVDGNKKKSKTQLNSVSKHAQWQPLKGSATQTKAGINRAEHQPNRSRPQRMSSKEKTQCQFIIGIEEESKFRVVRRILGKSGQNMKHIAQETGAKLRLLGCGSGYSEGQQESTEPLMLCLSAPDEFSYKQAKELVGNLMEDIYDDYREHCKKIGLIAPQPRLNVHEGYRQGAR